MLFYLMTTFFEALDLKIIEFDRHVQVEISLFDIKLGQFLEITKLLIEIFFSNELFELV